MIFLTVALIVCMLMAMFAAYQGRMDTAYLLALFAIVFSVLMK